MLHRGITLIELLIAIAILLVIGAIVTPIMVRTLDDRRFESAGEQLEQQLLLARSFAQRSGAPVEMRYYPETRRLTARRFIPSNDDSVANADRRFPMASRPGEQDADFFSFSPVDDDSQDESNIIIEAWAVRTLPQGIELRSERPQRTISDQPDILGNMDFGTWNLEHNDAPLRLAIFLPDGSAMLTRTAWLTDDQDRLGRIRVSTWTGTAKFERLPNVTDDTPTADDADEDAIPREAFDSGLG